MQPTVLGLDLAKTIFHLLLINQAGKVIKRKTVRRNQLAEVINHLQPCLIAMEACASAHYWGRRFQALGHQVVLLPPQHVKAYLRGQKNDYNDALAIAEAARHGALRPVSIKSVEQQDEQAMLRLRSQVIDERTRLINQTRGLLAEYGVVMAQGEAVFRRELPRLLENHDARLSARFCVLLARQYERLLHLDEAISWYQKQLEQQAKTDEVCVRLCQIPGFGPIVSAAFKSWIIDGKQYRNGRGASAALGVVPRQYSTGGKSVLLGITKRGDGYVRSLVIHGARSVVMRANTKDDPLSRWINRLVATRGFNKAVVALANKLIRIGWAVVARGETYQPQRV